MSTERERYVLRVNDSLVDVSKEVYEVFYRMDRRERYLDERDRQNGVVSYHALDTEGRCGEEILPVSQAESIENVFETKLMTKKLRQCLHQLEPTSAA